MAINQLTFHIVPIDGCNNSLKKENSLNNNELFDDLDFWDITKISRKVFIPLSSILPMNKSWSNFIDLYGTQDSNCVEVFYNTIENVISASFRIDFTSEYSQILNKIIKFCDENGFYFIYNNKTILPLNLEEIAVIIDNSIQVKRYKNGFYE